MASYILGISAFYHDAAAVLLRDGVPVAAAQEERFSRRKFDHRFPSSAISFCLQRAGIVYEDLDFVVFYEKPLRKFERILLTQMATFPRSWRAYGEAMIAWLKEKLWIKGLILEKVRIHPDRLLFVEHHLSHAASAMFCSPYDAAAVLTVDGVGEWTTTSIGTSVAGWTESAQASRIELNQEIRFPHSLGLLYSAFTAWLGFRVNSGEYKVMGMAAYGRPLYVDRVRKLITSYPDGSFELDMRYFSFHYSLSASFSARFVDLFGAPRSPETPFAPSQTERDQYYADVAASIQCITEEMLLGILVHLESGTSTRNLVMAGGVALNSSAIGRIMREGPFEQVYIQPNAGDAGGALGAALYVWHVLLGHPRRFVMDHTYYGDDSSDDDIVALLRAGNVPHERVPSQDKLVDRTVDALLDGEVVAVHRGRFEWGPRALGNRSILADPRRAETRDLVNRLVKFREPFRPFAPAMLEADVPSYVDVGRSVGQYPLRFMQMVAPVLPERADTIPAVVHGGTARLQVVSEDTNQFFHSLLRRFGEASGVPVLLNTSFNLRGEPMVAGPHDALSTFHASGIDRMIMGSCIVGN